MVSQDEPDSEHLESENLRKLVAARVASGEYPPNLEEELDRHYHSIVGSVGTRRSVLRARLQDLRHLHLGRGRVSTASRLPLGSFAHRMIGKVVSRQTDAIYQQLHEIRHATDTVVTELVAQMPTTDLAALEVQLRNLSVRMAELERSLADLKAQQGNGAD